MFFNHYHITIEECGAVRSPGKLHTIDRWFWGQDLNLRPSGYEPDILGFQSNDFPKVTQKLPEKSIIAFLYPTSVCCRR